MRRGPKVLEEWGPTVKMKNIISRKKNWAKGARTLLRPSLFLTKDPQNDGRVELGSLIWRNTHPMG